MNQIFAASHKAASTPSYAVTFLMFILFLRLFRHCSRSSNHDSICTATSIPNRQVLVQRGDVCIHAMLPTVPCPSTRRSMIPIRQGKQQKTDTCNPASHA
ncbi:uncharacterized protein J3D65DRAFT_463173 [Phyllosticta citribraziliensis]|uniref:Secreted protein n=1 Tax=Phyllosticta citribraziliensis TaxID=989973 RepID=A0ABR1LH51_9PEZI